MYSHSFALNTRSRKAAACTLTCLVLGMVMGKNWNITEDLAEPKSVNSIFIP